MSERYRSRLARAAELVEGEGFAAAVIGPSADLIYLTGYDALPYERLNALVIRPGSEPILIVPTLEAPLAKASPVGDQVEIRAWDDGEDPYEATASLLPGDGRIAVGDRMWAAHLLGLQ